MMLHLSKGHRIIKAIVAIVSISIIAWLLATRTAHSQQVRNTPAQDWQARHDIGTLEYRMQTLLGPDGTGSTSGTIKMMNDRMHNTEVEQQTDHDFNDKLMGGLSALGGLQTFNLIASLLTGKKGTT